MPEPTNDGDPPKQRNRMTTTKAQKRAITQKRISEVMDLRIKGHTIKQMSDTLGVSTHIVTTHLAKGLSQLREHNLALAESYRDLQVERVEEELRVWRPISLDTSIPEVALPALDRVHKLENQLMKLMGTENLPVQRVEQEVSITPIVLSFTPPADFVPPPDATLPPVNVIEGEVIKEPDNE